MKNRAWWRDCSPRLTRAVCQATHSSAGSPSPRYAAAVHDKNVNDDELLIVMTPHIVRMASSEGFAVQLPVGH